MPAAIGEIIVATLPSAGNDEGVAKFKTTLAVARTVDRIWHRTCSLFQPTTICHYLSKSP